MRKTYPTLPDLVEQIRAMGDAHASLRYAYGILIEKYYGDRMKTITRMLHIFQNDPELIWKRSGFLHCTGFNRLLKYLMLESGRFTPDQIRFRWTLIFGFSPHEYLQVKIGEKWISVDGWGARYGVPFGEYARFFKKFR